MSLTMKIYIIKHENTDLFLKNKRKTPVTIQIHVVYVTATNHGRTICFVFTLIEGRKHSKTSPFFFRIPLNDLYAIMY